MKLPIVLLLLLVISTTNSLKILGVFPVRVFSHFKYMHSIMRALAEAGHEVTVLSHFPDNEPHPNYKDILLPELDVSTNFIDLNWITEKPWYTHDFFVLHEFALQSCEITFNSTALKNILNSNEKYDIVLIEQFNTDCLMPIGWKLKAPVIGLCSSMMMPWHYDRFGNPLLPSYIPSIRLGYSDKMSFIERFHNWFHVNLLKFLYQYIAMPDTDKVIQKYMANDSVPPLSELVKEISLIFINSHYSYTGPRPNAPNVIELGGIHIGKEKPLDAELKNFLDSATDGVIYVSWGSALRESSLPEDKRTSFLEAFGSFKQKFLWKFENDSIPNKPDNVFIRKWMPQREILCHPNVRVFVSHGGLLGSSEAVYCGVPMVLIPIFSDQFHNAMAAKERGFGFVVHYEDITKDTVSKAIQNALSARAFQNAKAVSYSYRNRPKSPAETAVWWVEYVAATHGAPLLKSHSTNLSAFTYYSFDVFIAIGSIFILIAALCLFLFRKICGKTSKSKTD